MDVYQKLSVYINDHATTITNEWLSMSQEKESTYNKMMNSTLALDELRGTNTQLIQSLTSYLNSENEDSKEELRKWAKQVSEKRVEERVPLHETLTQFSNFRNVVWNYIKTFSKEFDLSLDAALDVSQRCNNALDDVIYQFSRHYYESSLYQIQQQQKLINDLSAPVIPITNQEAIIPLIGDLDPERTQHIQQHTLQQCNKHQYETVYLDMSGVQNIDTVVAHHLFQLIQSLDLLGVKSVICGMNPRVAQVAVQLGIRFSDVSIKSNLYHAINEAHVLQSH